MGVAVERGDIAAAKSLLTSHADTYKSDFNGKTPLYAAMLRGYIEMFELLLRANASIECPNSNGETLLHKAVITELRTICSIIIEV